jgi:xanthine dehydrogenase YagS FAD-binding subunit
VKAFDYVRVGSPAEAVALVTADAGARVVAGGTDLLNLMRDGVEQYDRMVDINHIGLSTVESVDGGLLIGGLCRMSDVAAHPRVLAELPALSRALLDSASPQVRNMASIGGNLLQRTRCWYFRDATMACNKRVPGSGCSAIGGNNRWHAILGGSDGCIAVHPSDLAVALLALDAVVLVLGQDGERRVPIAEFYLLPGDTPDRETALRHGELITGVEVPTTELTARSRYLKLRDRASFEFAVVSVAAAVRFDGDVVTKARLAFGGVGTIPWRSAEVEAVLVGGPLTPARLAEATRVLVRDAVPRAHNAFKAELVCRALTELLGGTW